MEALNHDIEQLISAGDYLSAYLSIREEKALQQVYIGRIVNAVVDELSQQTSRGNRERLYYLRSLLLWIFRDVPGLAPIYRSQLREGLFAEGSPDLLRLLRNLGGSVGRNVPRSPEEAAEGVKQTVDDVVDDIKSGNADRRMKDIFGLAEEGLRTGMKGVADFFDAISGTEASSSREQESEEAPPKAAPQEPEEAPKDSPDQD